MEFGPNLLRRLPASALERPLVDKIEGTVVDGRGDGSERMAAGVIPLTPYRNASRHRLVLGFPFQFLGR